jgi:hypothetical protein
MDIIELETKDEHQITQEELNIQTPLYENFDEDLERGEEVKLHLNDIMKKEELISYLDRTVNKWRKMWSINQDEKEATYAIQFIRQFFRNDDGDTDELTRNVLTILWKKRKSQQWDLNPAVQQSIIYSAMNYIDKPELLESKTVLIIYFG